MGTDFFGKIKRNVIFEGSIRTVYQYYFTVVGVALIFFDIKLWDTGWVFYVGLAFAGIGGISGRAIALKIKPFEEPPYPPGWLGKKGKKKTSDND